MILAACRKLPALPILAATLLPGTLLGAQDLRPERSVKGTTITSLHDPSLVISLPEAARYVGADRWILYDVADCELHVFVEADKHKVVQRMYWVQFEGYVPSRPELHHTYPFTETAKIAGLDFDLRARFGSSDEKPKPGSDLEHIQNLIRSAGYIMPPDMMNVRLVHLLDDTRRKELMIIYAEDLKPTGLTAADLMPGGKGSAQWPALQKALVDRAEKRITVIPATFTGGLVASK